MQKSRTLLRYAITSRQGCQDEWGEDSNRYVRAHAPVGYLLRCRQVSAFVLLCGYQNIELWLVNKLLNVKLIRLKQGFSLGFFWKVIQGKR